jgi:biopolymer transport protein ExbB/TolQ
MNPFSAAATFFKDGGAFMYPILGIGVVIAAIVVERTIVLIRASAGNSRRLTDDLVRAAARGDLVTARNIATSSTAPVARVAQAMLMVGAADEAALQSAADDAATLVLPSLSRRLANLSVLANSATLLGLLGTIFGLMTAFSGVGAADPSQRSAFLAAGISQALNTTAFGLIIAVPTLVFQGLLVGRVEGIVARVEETSILLSQALSRAAAARPASVTPIAASRPAAAPAAGAAPARAAVQGGGR